MRARACLPVNFHALPSRFSRHHAQELLIAVVEQILANLECHLALRVCLLQLGDDRCDQCAEVHRLAAQLATGQARQLEQIVNQMRHTLAGRTHALQMLAPVVLQPIAIVFEQHLTEAVDAAQRRAQIMRHRVAECFELAVGSGQLGRALLHQLLEMVVVDGAAPHPWR